MHYEKRVHVVYCVPSPRWPVPNLAGLCVFCCPIRHQKCKTCYKQLKNLSNMVKNKAGQVGRHGSAFRELQLLMAPLDA